MFGVGDLVICIHDYRGKHWLLGNDRIYLGPDAPHPYNIYTVTRYFKNTKGMQSLQIKEYKTLGRQYGFHPEHFRKVIDYKETMKKAESIKKDKPIEIKT